MQSKPCQSIDEYIAGFSEETQVLLEQMRETIRLHAPNAEETIAYMIPTFKLDGTLVHFAGYAKHIGFYPGPTGLAAFADEIVGYKSAKGSVQFPIHEPLPLDLVGKIVSYRVLENKNKVKKKKNG